jgi:hypothetical protein
MVRIVRSAVVAAILVAGGLFVVWRLTTNHGLAELQSLNAVLQQQLSARQAMIDRLSRSRRIGHVEIVDQTMMEDGAVAETKVRFIELDDAGAELARQEFTVPGDVMFIDAWTVKFAHDAVADGDPLRGKTLILLRRMYSDRMAPLDGLPIDTPGAVPAGYAASDAARFEQIIWRNFWTYAADAKKAADMGIRVAQGEAVYKAVKAGQRYELIVDADGGINLTPLAEESALTRGGA